MTRKQYRPTTKKALVVHSAIEIDKVSPAYHDTTDKYIHTRTYTYVLMKF